MMDNFYVDLDEVLDAFEQSEHATPQSLQVTSNSSQNEYRHDNQSLNTMQDTSHSLEINAEKSINADETDDFDDDAIEIFDLSEANFGPTSMNHSIEHQEIYTDRVHHVLQDNCAPFSNGHERQEGYFVPEDIKQEPAHPMGEICDINFSANNHIVAEFDDVKQPELLQTALQLQTEMGLNEDRPSFMSNSPPRTISYSEAPNIGSFSDDNTSDEQAINVSNKAEFGLTEELKGGDSINYQPDVVSSSESKVYNQQIENKDFTLDSKDGNQEFKTDFQPSVDSMEFNKDTDKALNLNNETKLASTPTFESEAQLGLDVKEDISHTEPVQPADQTVEIATRHGNTIDESLQSRNSETEKCKNFEDMASVIKDNEILETAPSINVKENEESHSATTVETPDVVLNSEEPTKASGEGINSDQTFHVSKSSELESGTSENYNQPSLEFMSSENLTKAPGEITNSDKMFSVSKSSELVTETSGNYSQPSMDCMSSEVKAETSRICDPTLSDSKPSELQNETSNNLDHPYSEPHELENETSSKLESTVAELKSTELETKSLTVEIKPEITLTSDILSSSDSKVSDVAQDSKEDGAEIEKSESTIIDNVLSGFVNTDTVYNEVDSELLQLEKELQTEERNSAIETTSEMVNSDNKHKVSVSENKVEDPDIEKNGASSVVSDSVPSQQENMAVAKVSDVTQDFVLDRDNKNSSDMSANKNNVPTEDVSKTFGARPKQPPTPVMGVEKSKKMRPDSLLGLSKPDLSLGEPVQEHKILLSEQTRVSNMRESEINPLYLASMQRPAITPPRKAQVVNQPNFFPGNENTSPQIPQDQSFTFGAPQQFTQPRPPPPAYSTIAATGSGQQLVNGHGSPRHPEPNRTFQQPSIEDTRADSFGNHSFPTSEQVTSIPTIPGEGSNIPQIPAPPSQDGGRFNQVENASEATEQDDSVYSESSRRIPAQLEAPPGLTVSPGNPSAMMIPPQSSSNPELAITDLGKVAPTWMPDAEAANCLQCNIRFTFTKRRHHCRACGKIFCNTCCNLKNKLQYLEFKEARVCSKCYQDLIRAQVYERMGTGPPSPAVASVADPHITGTGDVVQGTAEERPSPYNTNTPSNVRQSREGKQVIFSDGIRPGGDLSEPQGSAQSVTSMRRSNRKSKSSSSNGLSSNTRKEITHFLKETSLPPVFICMGENGELIKEDNPGMEDIMQRLSTDESTAIPFVVNKNLQVLVTVVNMDCCLNKTCICFTSVGLCTVGQEEVVIALEKFPDECTLPLDIFRHFQHLYEQATKGHTVSSMDYGLFSTKHGNSFLDSPDHGGFLYIRPSFQCLNKLTLPKDQPYLFGLLLQKWELPWAKVFPLRLMLRLGAEFRYYPCPVVSVRCRKPVYGEIGHTIMNLLVDFRNYQYSIPFVRGFTIHMEKKKTYLSFPRNRYRDVSHVLSSGNEHVMAIAATFSEKADSYLVCIQNDDGNYETQAINIQSRPRKVTGATFVVFNGALKPSVPGLIGKSSIVEDGLMVQVLPEKMSSIREALKNMEDLTLLCGSNSSGEPEEEVIIQWVEEDKLFNVGVKSPVDDFSLEGVESIRIHNTPDYSGPSNKALRWTEVFFLQSNEQASEMEPVDLSRLAETLATSTCVALSPKLKQLSEAGFGKLGLRASIGNDNVGYECGAGGQKLPDFYMNALDNELIPVIHNAVSQNRNSSVVLELIFHIINT